MTSTSPALSFVVPLYNSAGTIRGLISEICSLQVEGGHEIILVNDGSTDATADICSGLLETCQTPITYVEHARNFGEHNAVLTGWRHAAGRYIVNLDDDGQNPPAEAVRLFRYAIDNNLDVAFGQYSLKRHAAWRNWGSRLTNRLTDMILDKPKGFYLSSFRCVSAPVAHEVAANIGPFPYIDGLILQVTQRIGGLQVYHSDRASGESGYTLRRLLRLWLSTVVNFSVMPLRLATVLGLVMSAFGFMGIGLVLYWRLTHQGPAFGWGSLMSALLLFSGVQLALLGVIGEYLGRMFLTVNQRPQSVIREVSRGGGLTASSVEAPKTILTVQR
ncbi:MAG: glycosyltransferase [Blastocatellia bacterium]|nr:glycosyltransferase [Blastocatellia bacterium]